MEVETQLSGGRLWRKSQSKRIEAWDSADGQFRIAQQGSESFLLIAFGRRAEDGDILTRWYSSLAEAMLNAELM